MKTTLERMFEKHDKEFDKMNFLRWLSDNRKELLEAEKKQIMEAYTLGHCMHDSNDENSAEQYYTQTYKSDE